jgi:hypothetical protein
MHSCFSGRTPLTRGPVVSFCKLMVSRLPNQLVAQQIQNLLARTPTKLSEKSAEMQSIYLKIQIKHLNFLHIPTALLLNPLLSANRSEIAYRQARL